MPTTYKVLAQVYPTAATASTLYTVPSSTQTVISTINVANQSTNADTIRIAVRPAGQTLEAKHYIVYDIVLPARAQYQTTSGITLGATDVVTVYSANGTSSFNSFGSEIS